MDTETIDLTAASEAVRRASEAVRRAKRALLEAERRFETDCRPDNTFLLLAEIEAAERRVAEAKAQLRNVAGSV